MVPLLSSTWFCPANLGSTNSAPPMKLFEQTTLPNHQSEATYVIYAYDAKQKELRQCYSTMPMFSCYVAVNVKKGGCYGGDQEHQD